MPNDKRFPDFYVVGAPKAATTSLYHYLSQHPGIYVPEIKEPHFFSCPEVKETYYKVVFVEEEYKYLSLYSNKMHGQKAGDFSPSYLFSKKAASRIHYHRPDAQIIAVLRNPVDRAISHYLMDVRDGYQDIPLFEVISSPSKYALFYREYVGNGLYASQLERYLSLFDGNNVKVILYDDLMKGVGGVLKGILNFLNLSDDFEFDLTSSYNSYRMFRSPFLKKITMSNNLGLVKRLIPSSVKKKMFSVFTTRDKPSFEAERKVLVDIFSDDILRLETIIGRDLSTWLC